MTYFFTTSTGNGFRYRGKMTTFYGCENGLLSPLYVPQNRISRIIISALQNYILPKSEDMSSLGHYFLNTTSNKTLNIISD
jgi:hypothetical protein